CALPILDQARKKYGGQLAVVVMPLPLSHHCNAYVPETLPEHENACQLAYLAINLWRTKPEAFDGFHHWLFAGDHFRTQEEALAYLDEKFGKDFVDRMIADEAPAQYIDEALRLADPERPKALFNLMPAILGSNQISEGAFTQLEEIMQPLSDDFGPPRQE
ncbi:MAG: DsbA family protein, partial [Blastopirellula sp. JB062]